MENQSKTAQNKEEYINQPRQRTLRFLSLFIILSGLVVLLSPISLAAEGGEASLIVPDLSTVEFFGINARLLLGIGLVVCALGLLFGLFNYLRVKGLPVHKSMRDISELIYETCKTYLITQGKFLLILWAFISFILSCSEFWSS
jgi:K(+)-stimulated pyrophosphate-energized sodium pump